jgi:hyperosmotically inducible periplasmic protein
MQLQVPVRRILMSRKGSSLLAMVAAFAVVAMITGCAASDAGITTKVKAKLAADSTVKASQINVDTKDKVVTLSGKVDSEAAKAQAVALARGTEGVADVVDNLTLTAAEPQSADAGRSVGQVIDDASITAAVKTKLMADSVAGALKIDVDTKDGVVSLNGPVKNQTEKDTAIRIARETSGVKDVRDNLVVQSG